MTDETIGTVEAHEVILERCPTGCGHWKRATLPMKWEQDVEHGFAIPIVGCGNPWHYTNLAAAPMTDETARLRDALGKVLADHAIVPNQNGFHGWRCEHPDRYPDYCHCVPDLLDDLMAVAAEARAGLVSVEAVREAAHWLERSQREQNVHQFRHGMALLRAALAGPTPSPAVERLDVQEVLDVLGSHEGNGCCDPKTLEHVAQDIHGLADAADILAALAATPPAPAVERPDPERLLAAIEAQAIGEVEA